ncbi:hypothetical protein UlMin_019019 [Ulmus minor]
MRNDGDLAGQQAIDLEKMCRHAVDRSSGQLFDITLEHFGDDDLIAYIVSSSSQIKHLRLACCYHISDEGLVKALAKLPLLEELELTHCSFSVEPLEAVGHFCRNLKSLKLNYKMYRSFSIQPDEEAEYNEEANAIAKNMPALRNLQLIGNCMTNMGLQAILDGCPHLESLDLRRCLHLNLKEGLGKKCADRVKVLQLPHESTEGSRFDFGESTDGSRSYEYEDYLSGLSADDYADDYLENYLGGDDYLGFGDDDYFDYDDFTVLPFDDWLDF